MKRDILSYSSCNATASNKQILFAFSNDFDTHETLSHVHIYSCQKQNIVIPKIRSEANSSHSSLFLDREHGGGQTLGIDTTLTKIAAMIIFFAVAIRRIRKFILEKKLCWCRVEKNHQQLVPESQWACATDFMLKPVHILSWDLRADRLRYYYYERTGSRALLKYVNREFKKPRRKLQWKRR